MNKFSRLFQDRQIAAQAKAKEKLEENPVAAAIAAATEAIGEKAKKDAEDSASVHQVKAKKKTATRKTTTRKTAAKADPPVKLKPAAKVKKATKPKKTTEAAIPPRKRGRPANGKRSNPGWHGRTFYIRKHTDELLEDALFKLKRSGMDLDKSQLVDALLNAWAQVELEKVEDFQIGEILEKPDAD